MTAPPPVHPTLHILAQSWPHEPAFVIGGRAGLTALHNAIQRAMRGGAAKATVMGNDGEGYGLVVVCREDMSDVPVPYVDPSNENVTDWPEWLVEAARRVGE